MWCMYVRVVDAPVDERCERITVAPCLHTPPLRVLCCSVSDTNNHIARVEGNIARVLHLELGVHACWGRVVTLRPLLRCVLAMVAHGAVCPYSSLPPTQPLLEFPAVTVCNNNPIVLLKIQDPSHPMNPIINGHPPRHFTVEQVRVHSGRRRSRSRDS